MKRKIWLTIEVIAGLILIILLTIFAKRKIEDKNYLTQQQKIQNNITLAKHNKEQIKRDTPIENKKEKRNTLAKEEVEKLKEKHPSVIGIIEIPETNILYPIVQGKDNLFYLDHDKDGKYNQFGEVYIDCRNNEKFKDKNTIIYGHNIRSAKTIFNELLKYEDEEFFKRHRLIYIYTLEGFREYKVTNILKVSAKEPYREMNFNSEEDFQEFVKKYYEMSLVKEELPQIGNILTLSTCFNDKYRFVIQGVELN